MSLSLIITTYNRPDALLLVLRSIMRQTQFPNEIIIADDGSDNFTKKCIDNFQKSSSIKLIHSWHPDEGFRVAMCRNKAIVKASSDYIVMIDGDMILHSKFIEDHVKHAEPGFFVQGSRSLLKKDVTKKALADSNIDFSFFSKGLNNRKNALHSFWLNKIFSKKMIHLGSVRTCNMGFYKQDSININGFNNDIKGWGREDSEFASRLLNNGIYCKVVRFNLLQFHLWHQNSSRLNVLKNDAILQICIDQKLKWCESGLNKYL